MTDKDVYKKLCLEGSPYVPAFMQPWWLDAVCADWNVVLARKGDAVTGAWAYPLEQKLRVTLLRNPVMTPYLGPQVFYPADIKERNRDNFEHETVSELLKQLPAAKVWHLSMQPGMKQAGIFKNYDLQPQVQQTFLIDLAADEQALLANMKESTRRNIRAGEKELTITDEPALLSELYRFNKATLARKNKQAAYTLKGLQRIMDACLANKSASLWVARSNGVVKGIVWHVWDEKGSYYLTGSQNPDAESNSAMASLLWHAIKEAKKMGHQSFDLEGSMDQGVERFFRSFGGERALYMVLIKNDSLLWKMKQLVYR